VLKNKYLVDLRIVLKYNQSNKVSGAENGKRTVCRDRQEFILWRLHIQSNGTPGALSAKVEGNHPMGTVHKETNQAIQRRREVWMTALRTWNDTKNRNDSLSL
jgi:hypothetical protein